MTSGPGGQDPRQGWQPPQDQPGRQDPPPPQGQDPPPTQGWQPPPPQGWQDPQQGWQGQPPYGYAAAPSAPGQYFAPEAPERPTTVRVGIGAFLATLILGVISSLVQFSDIDGLVAQAVALADDPAVTEDVIRAGVVVGAVIGLLLVALQALFIWFAWNGRNWARIVLFVIGGLGIVSGLAGLAGGGSLNNGFVNTLSVFQLLLLIVGVVALAQKVSSEWYRHEGWRRSVSR